MADLFTSEKLALKAKKKGFDEPCLAKWMLLVKGDKKAHFIENYPSEGLWFKHNSTEKEYLWAAPMYQQLIDWLIEEHDIHLEPVVDRRSNHNKRKYGFMVQYFYNKLCKVVYIKADLRHKSLEKALAEAIKLIKINGKKN